MPGAQEMPLAEVLQALGRTPASQPQLRAVLATTCARWHLQRGQVDEAVRHLSHAVEMVPDLRPGSGSGAGENPIAGSVSNRPPR